MRISLLTKNVVGICIALTALFFAGFFYHYTDIKKYQIDSEIDELRSQSELISYNIGHEISENEGADIQYLLQHMVGRKKNIVGALVIDSVDNIHAAYPRDFGDSVLKELGTGDFRQNLKSDSWSCIIKTPIPVDSLEISTPNRFLVIKKSLMESEKLLNTFTTNQLIIYLVALFGMILVTIWISTVMLISPIRKISKATREVAAGEFSPLPEIDTHDEIGDLIRSFNTMIAKLANMREELEHHNKNLQEKVAEEAEKLKIATQQLHQNEKLSALGQLIAGVAHELNNPLAIIMGNSQLLLALDPDEELSRRINVIYQSAERSQKIVQNLLSFARQSPSKKSYIGLNGLISDCLELKSYDYKTHKIETVIDFEENLPKTMADFNQLQQVCIIILENAQHALGSIQSDREMRIKTTHMNKTIKITFSDNGPGIPMDIQNRIFEPFYTTKEQGKGTGLGLSIAYGIIHRHKGKFYVESENGKGATFVIELPIISDQTATDFKTPAIENKEDKRNAGSKIPTGKSVLIVDDEIEMVEMLFNLLKKDGYQVDTARNGRQALEKIQLREFDIIISDVKMPVMNGMQLYDILKERKPKLAERIIFISGDIINKETIRFLKTCGCMYLGKPFKIESLKNCVTNLITSKEYVEPVAPNVFLERSI